MFKFANSRRVSDEEVGHFGLKIFVRNLIRGSLALNLNFSLLIPPARALMIVLHDVN